MVTKGQSLSCAQCGEEFIAKVWNAKFCSKICKDRSYDRTEYRRSISDWQKSYARSHYQANKEHYKNLTKAWRRTHYDRYRKTDRARKRRARGADPEKYRLEARLRQRRVKSLGVFTKEDWHAIPFNDLCSYCGKRGRMDIEHVVPISRGGLNVPENIVPACGSCNGRKHDNSLIYFLAQRSA